MSEAPVMLITGSRTGIGRHLAQHYAGQGFRVVGCSRSQADFHLEHYEHFTLDITQEEALKALFGALQKRYGRLDVLINNAGLSAGNYLQLTSPATVREVLETNLLGAILCCREALHLMQKKRFGRILTFSSIHVPLSTPGTSIYGTSKAALEHFSRVLAREAYGFGVTVNTLSLSVVEGSGMAETLTEEKRESLVQQTISKACITMEDVIHALDFLISPHASKVTSQNLIIGGL